MGSPGLEEQEGAKAPPPRPVSRVEANPRDNHSDDVDKKGKDDTQNLVPSRDFIVNDLPSIARMMSSKTSTTQTISAAGDDSKSTPTSFREERAAQLIERTLQEEEDKLRESGPMEIEDHPGAHHVSSRQTPTQEQDTGTIAVDDREPSDPTRTRLTALTPAIANAVLVEEPTDDAEVMIERLRNQGRIVSAREVLAIDPSRPSHIDIEHGIDEQMKEQPKRQKQRRMILLFVLLGVLVAAGAVAGVILTRENPMNVQTVDGSANVDTAAMNTLFPTASPTMKSFTGLSIQQLGNQVTGSNQGDKLGFDTAMNDVGNIVALGTFTEEGYVRVLQYGNGSWMQLGDDLTISGTQNFGKVIAMNSRGNRVAAGFYQQGGRLVSPGHVNVYEWDEEAQSWYQLGNTIDGEADADGFGFAMHFDSSGDRLIISAIWNSGSGEESCHARVFDWNGSQWTQTGGDINGRQAGDRFGFSVVISSDGSRIAISAAAGNSEDGSILDPGYVQVFDLKDKEWILQFTLEGLEAEAKFGQSLDFSSDGRVMVVGARRDDAGGQRNGLARVFRNVESSWQQVGDDINGATSNAAAGFASAISNDGNFVVVGSNGENESIGASRMFGWDAEANTWTQIGLTLTGTAQGSSFGFSVNINGSGRRILVGAPDSYAETGEVRVWEYS